jgi:hypothetical protein
MSTAVVEDGAGVTPDRLALQDELLERRSEAVHEHDRDGRRGILVELDVQDGAVRRADGRGRRHEDSVTHESPAPARGPGSR